MFSASKKLSSFFHISCSFFFFSHIFNYCYYFLYSFIPFNSTFLSLYYLLFLYFFSISFSGVHRRRKIITWTRYVFFQKKKEAYFNLYTQRDGIFIWLSSVDSRHRFSIVILNEFSMSKSKLLFKVLLRIQRSTPLNSIWKHFSWNQTSMKMFSLELYEFDQNVYTIFLRKYFILSIFFFLFFTLFFFLSCLLLSLFLCLSVSFYRFFIQWMDVIKALACQHFCQVIFHFISQLN